MASRSSLQSRLSAQSESVTSCKLGTTGLSCGWHTKHHLGTLYMVVYDRRTKNTGKCFALISYRLIYNVVWISAGWNTCTIALKKWRTGISTYKKKKWTWKIWCHHRLHICRCLSEDITQALELLMRVEFSCAMIGLKIIAEKTQVHGLQPPRKHHSRYQGRNRFGGRSLHPNTKLSSAYYWQQCSLCTWIMDYSRSI